MCEGLGFAVRMQNLEDRMASLEREVIATLKANSEQIAILESAFLERDAEPGTSFEEPQVQQPIRSISRQPITIELMDMKVHANSRRRESTTEAKVFPIYTDPPEKEAAAFEGITSFAGRSPHVGTPKSFSSAMGPQATSGVKFRRRLTTKLNMKPAENTLPQSPYEAVILLGRHGDETRTARSTVIISIITSVAVQVVLCGSFLIMNEQKAGTIDHVDARRWRTGPGHGVSHLGTLDYSLVSRACDFDGALSSSASQVDILIDIKNYLHYKTIFTLWTFPFGGVLVTTVCLTWSMKAASELIVILKYLHSLLSVPRGITRITSRPVCDDGMLYIESISSQMRALAGVTCLFHALVCASAWGLGCMYISQTSSVEDMVINGLGVAVILDVEKQIFKVLVAKRVQTKLKQIRFGSFRARAWQKVLAVTIPLLLTIYVQTVPLCKELAAYIREACGGEKTFAVGMSQETGVMVVAPTREGYPKWKRADDHSPDPTGMDHHRQIIYDIILGREEWRESSKVFRETTIRNMRIAMAKPLSQLRDEIDPTCNDLDFGQLAQAYLYALRWQIGLPDAKRCDDFNSTVEVDGISACHLHSSRLLRSLCPQTCGCDNLESGLFFTDGCPNSCDRVRQWRAESGTLLNSIADASGQKCRNVPPAILSNLTAWNIYVRSLIWNWKRDFALLKISNETEGTYFPQLLNGICPDSSEKADSPRKRKIHQNVVSWCCPLSGFAFWCPQTCGCDRTCRGSHSADCYPDCNPFCHHPPGAMLT